MTKTRKGSLGLDFGGSLLRACLLSPNGRVLRRARLVAPRLEAVPAAALALLRRWNAGPLDGLVLGGTGIWTAAAKRRIKKALSAAARRVQVLSDVELAHRAAFDGGPGILIVAGTGSIAFARDDKGRTARAGGWGALLGDEGSAFWIGKEALKDPRLNSRLPSALALAHHPETVRRTADLARRIAALAPENRAANALLDRAAAHLAGLAIELKTELHWRGPVPAAWTGGLFRSRVFRAKFCRALKATGLRLTPVPIGIRPEEAAARIALGRAIDSRSPTR
ncbi:MAG: hypothetical protein KGL04_07855 [Elusimicrobia bacterium]|nr:hypothetical protein [Elusimicrobiota bacterium]